ncbi:hypothetical protein DZF91_22405 [Actinomadura logoneensis]|uniref:site-specific DNA-methyltransferase (adenine-specific) n=1 Tax=Actinomadura logoneensis TaxID=2293572 RepID=A0A372JHD2_9ACTN|nr:type IIL restriction-modification enzyme MmeI [Actinomadura logoneensis]RFU39425.1 hypothetical protein DZF91_22405 [Actinomadura logoneensis]
MPRFPKHKSAEFNHNDWLSLIDVSGPFLSIPVLRRAWPTLDALDKATRERLRLEHTALPGAEWINYVLTGLLGWDEAVHFEGLDALAMDVPEHETEVVPSFALLEPGTAPGSDAKPVRLLGLITEDSPTRRVKDSAWAATPVDRLAQLCRHHDVELGLATDGRWWALVWAPRGGVTATAVFDAVNWHEAAERDVVRAFVSLLRRERFFSVPDDETLPALLKAGLDNQEEITEALGVQVRQAVELLVAAIGRAHTRDKDQGGEGLGDISAHEVYRGAVAVMMRVVFLLFAEERGLLPSDKELYRTAYSAGLLCQELEERAVKGSEEDLEHTHTGWHRLLALFNAVYHGVDHPDMQMSALDGSIFDPTTYAWLPHAIDDRTVLHMLRSVQHVTIGTGKSRERRKLSFRALDVEQIGYVYEGLLAFEGFYATETIVGLVGKAGLEEEVALSALENFAAQSPDVPTLAATLAKEYKDSGIGSAKALEKRLAPLSDADKQEARRRLLAVTNGDYPLAERLLPFYGLIRTDLRDLPVVILTDALYVTESSLRKNTGTHYTPRFLAEEVVEGALEPLVYEPGPLQTADKSQWKPKSSKEILDLKVADIAMGSGAFLVAACRYLAGHLIEAWAREGEEGAREFLDQPGYETADMDADPVVIKARRKVIEHCLYGADINEMAVEMAKLSLWLVSMDPHRPFTFLDDRLITGDSLLGITSLDQLEVMHMDPKRGRELHKDALLDWTAGAREVARDIAAKRRAITAIEGTTLETLAAKRALLKETEEEVQEAWFYADLTVAAALAHAKKGPTGLDTASILASGAAQEAASSGRINPASCDELSEWLNKDVSAHAFRRQPIHWPLVFPEVFAEGGFDAVIGNPPFLGGTKITGPLGMAYREYLSEVVAGGVRASGRADLVAYFLLRGQGLLVGSGQLGIVATNTLAQSDTREVGLDQIISGGSCIRRAVKSAPWPSKSAALEYCEVSITRASMGREASYVLNGEQVKSITAALEVGSRVSGSPFRLRASQGISFQGWKLDGMGFVLTPDEARALLDRDPVNREVIMPYIVGQDVNSRPDVSASRWVINFRDWSQDQASKYSDPFARVVSLVKPERQENNRKSHRERWWQFAETRPGLVRAISKLDRVVVITLHTKFAIPVFAQTGQVFSHALGVFASADPSMLTLLSSSPHFWWAVKWSSTLGGTIRYTSSDVFETLPLPEMTQEMRELGDRLDRVRRNVMLARLSGLTATYNLVHSQANNDHDIVELREIHRLVDEAVCRAYGWGDLIPQLAHDYYSLGHETRYTVAPAIQREFVDRLLELNHERYAAEVAAGLHDKKGKKKAQKVENPGLF